MIGNFKENECGDAASRRLMERIDATYPRGWFVAIGDDRIVAAAADFRELEGMLRELGKDPRDNLVVEAGVARPEYVTIFI